MIEPLREDEGEFDAKALVALPVRAAVNLVSFSMSLDDLAGLRRGETLVTTRNVDAFATLYVNGKAIGRLECGQVDGKLAIRCLTNLPNGPSTETDTRSEPSRGEDEFGVGALAAVSVRATVELASLPMSLGDVDALRRGETFVTDVDANAPATLRINGKSVGHLECGQVDGKLAIRLLANSTGRGL